jgi:beta-glucosidase
MKEQELRDLMGQMTLEEKVGQLVQLDGGCFGGGDVATGPQAKIGVTQADVDVCGSVLNVIGADEVHRIQDSYLERSRLKVPLLFMDDVIYGYQTCFPAPIGLGATWDPDLIHDDYRLVAQEAAADGCMVTFSPAVDIVRDARWGRCLEMPGEDPYLSSRFAGAMVTGFQGDHDLANGENIASCVKHFAGYGAAEGGREYNTVDMSERRFRQDYLPPYKAAVDAGCELVMSSFNTVDEVPATGNKWLMDQVLRQEWGFRGVTITDYAAILELINHGVAANKDEASKLAMDATIDIDMKTDCYAGHLAALVRAGKVDEAAVDEACWRVLVLKNKLGLFEDPYHGCDAARAAATTCTPEKLAAARKTADEALVLLRNECVEGAPVLPLAKGAARADGRPQRIALIGPYADSKDIVGMWAIHADRKYSHTVRQAFEQVLGQDGFSYALGADVLDAEGLASLGSFAAYATGGYVPGDQDALRAEALEVARNCDVAVLCLGEHMLQSGEAGARTDITLPQHQRRLLHEVHELGVATVVVLFNGRPLALTDVLPDADAIVEAWFPGTAGGDSVADVLFGDANPSGRLAMSFPVNAGQAPLYYAQFSTGRPAGKNHTGRFITGYLDAPITGLYPFGYGLSYHTSEVRDLRLSAAELRAGQSIQATVTLTNTGDREGTDVVQLYLRDLVGSVVRPVKELKGFQRVTLAAGDSRDVTFEIDEPMLRFWRWDMTFGSEPGEFQVMVGLSSQDVLAAGFTLVGE